MNEFPLALVTGGANRLGRVVVLTLARLGYAIVLQYNRSKQEAEQTGQEVRELGVPVHLIQADLSDERGISLVFEAIDGLATRLTVMVNSAATMDNADILATTARQWDQTLALNLRAPLLMVQKAAERMAEGVIINITEAGDKKTWTKSSAYLVSKSALETLTRIQAKALAPGIRVNAIAPGPVFAPENMASETWDRLVARLPIPGSIESEDIASAVEFIIKNQSLTGQTIVVDRGYSLI